MLVHRRAEIVERFRRRLEVETFQLGGIDSTLHRLKFNEETFPRDEEPLDIVNATEQGDTELSDTLAIARHILRSWIEERAAALREILLDLIVAIRLAAGRVISWLRSGFGLLPGAAFFGFMRWEASLIA